MKPKRGKGALEIFDAYDVPWRAIGRESATQAACNWLHKAKAGQSLTAARENGNPSLGIPVSQ